MPKLQHRSQRAKLVLVRQIHGNRGKLETGGLAVTSAYVGDYANLGPSRFVKKLEYSEAFGQQLSAIPSHQSP